MLDAPSARTSCLSIAEFTWNRGAEKQVSAIRRSRGGAGQVTFRVLNQRNPGGEIIRQ